MNFLVDYQSRCVSVKYAPAKGTAIVCMHGKLEDGPELEGYLDAIRQIYAHGKPFVIMYNCLDVSWATVAFLQGQGKFMFEMAERTAEQMYAACVVLTPVIRHLLNIVFLVKQPACPFLACETIAEAQAFLRPHRARILAAHH